MRAVLRLLKLERGELGRVLLFAVLAFLLQLGLSIGMSVGDAVFLARAGADKLPYIFILTPLVMVVYTPVMSYLTGRLGVARVLDVTLLVLVAGGGALFFGIREAESLPAPFNEWIYFAARIYAAVWYIGLYTLFWNFCDDYFNIQDGKRLYAFFSAGAALGGSFGGGLVGLLATQVEVAELYLVWAAVAFLTLPVAIVIRNRFRRMHEDDGEDEAGPGGFLRQMGDAARVVRQSAFVPAVVTVFVMSLMLANLNEYKFLQILEEGRDQEQLAVLFGQLYGAVSLLTLTINLFIFNRLVLNFGVHGVAIIVPSLTLVLFTWYFVDNGMAVALFGFVVLHGLVSSIDFNNANFLFNAIDPAHRKQVRTFVEGLCEPVVTCGMGFFLLFAAPRLSAEQIAAVGVALAIGLIVAVLVMRQFYRAATIQNLRRGWLDFGRPQGQLLAALDTAQMERLQTLVADPDTSQDESLMALRLLFARDPAGQLEPLLAFLMRADEDGRRAAVPILRHYLDDGESEVVLRVVDSLHRGDLLNSPAIVQELGAVGLMDRTELERLSASVADTDMRAALVVPLWQSADTRHGMTALGILDRMRAGDDAERCAAVRVLGRLRLVQFGQICVQFLADPSPQVQAAALHALRDHGRLLSTRLLEPILAAMARADTETRIVGMEVIASSGDPASLLRLYALADRFTPFELRAAEAVATAIGPAAIPVLVTLLQDREAAFAARSVAARAMVRLSLPQFQAVAAEIVAGELARAETARLRRLALSPDGAVPQTPGLRVLRHAYGDLERDCVEFALLVLCQTGNLPDYDLLLASLASPNPKVRGNALETLEQGVDRPVFRRLIPFLAPESTDAAAPPPRQLPDPTMVVAEAAESGSPIEAAAAIQALWETDAPEIRQLMRNRLAPGRSDILQLTLLDLTTPELDRRRLTLVERLGLLIGVEPFGQARLRELLDIALAAEHCIVAVDTELFAAGDVADALCILVRGEAELIRGGIRTTVAAGVDGGVFGREALEGTRYLAGVHLRDAELLAVPRRTMLAAAQTYPRLALHLFERRVMAA